MARTKKCEIRAQVDLETVELIEEAVSFTKVPKSIFLEQAALEKARHIVRLKRQHEAAMAGM